MSFCSQCGKELTEGGRFCSSCGARIRQTGSFADASINPEGASQTAKELLSDSRQNSSAGYVKVIGVLNIVIMILLFMPWLNLNLYLWSDSYSLPGLVEVAGSLYNNISSLLGSSYTSTSFGSTVPAILFAIAAAWLVVVVLLIRDLYMLFVGKSRVVKTGAGAALVLAGVTALVAIFLNMQIGNELGVSVDVVSSTIWLWTTLVISICTLALSSHFSTIRGS